MAEVAAHLPARLMIVEGHRYLQELIHNLLTLDLSVEIVAELESGVEAILEGRRLGVELILMDVHLPDTNGLAVTHMLKRMLPGCRVILMISRPELRGAALESGAADTIVKERLSADLSATLARNSSAA
jgi:two-component system, NarL family, response regulator DesR